MTSAQPAPGLRVRWQVAPDEPDAADRLLAVEVARMLGCRVDEVHLSRLCPHCGSSGHGRPVARTDADGPAPYVSLGRAPGAVVVAVSRDRPVGVDIEKEDAAQAMASPDVVLHPEERAEVAHELTTAWVRKESLLKATGDGLRVDPARIRLSDAHDEPELLEWVGEGAPSAVWMRDLRIDGYAACLTVLGDRTELSPRPAAPAAPSR